MQTTYTKSPWKIIIVAAAVFIAALSLYQTNVLVSKLAEREYKQIDLFAKTQDYVAKAEGGDNLNFLLTEVLQANKSIPVILTDEKGNPTEFRNIQGINSKTSEKEKERILTENLEEMKQQHPPIKVEPAEGWVIFIYYKDSKLITRLTYFPYIQMAVIGILSVMVYLIFTSNKRAEQNRVWVGLAKETAHQLGTPISGMMAWMELLKTDESLDQSIVVELEKDIARLRMITDRFSNIGSVPSYKDENVRVVIEEISEYLRHRVSSKVIIKVETDLLEDVILRMNRSLFEWVIENLCKNAVDAMVGKGHIDIFFTVTKDDSRIMIDISDTGKGIPASKINRVFDPGFTTKKRGWGLGLTLVKRIVEQYHNGKITVLRSKPDVGTTFRILMPIEKSEYG